MSASFTYRIGPGDIADDEDRPGMNDAMAGGEFEIASTRKKSPWRLL
jgi:hypothetical protein